MSDLTVVYFEATVSLPGLLARARQLAEREVAFELSRTVSHRTVTMPTDVAVALHAEHPYLTLVPPPPVPAQVDDQLPAPEEVNVEPVKKSSKSSSATSRGKTKSKKSTTSSRGKSRSGDRGES